MWTARNDFVHGSDKSTRLQARRRRLWLKILHLHTKRSEALALDQCRFIGDTTDDVEQLIATHRLSHIENWLPSAKPVLLDSVKAAHAYSLECVQPLSTYFCTIHTPAPSNRPPKPRYSKTAHTRHDRNRARKRQTRSPPSRTFLLTSYFSRLSKTQSEV
jgi:hypothetical protein